MSTQETYINAVAFIDGESGAAITYDGVYPLTYDGGTAEVVIPVAEFPPDVGPGAIGQTTAENLTEREGDLVVVLQDGSVATSGYTTAITFWERDEQNTENIRGQLEIVIDCGARGSLSQTTVGDIEV